jgi:glutaminyl-peptide cyclotransferase
MTYRRLRPHLLALALALVAAAAACLPAALPAAPAQRAAPVAVDTYRVVKAYPHDPDAYTQGLIVRDGVLYESTGLNGRSSLRKVKLETGEVLQQQRIDPEYFAEGLAEWKGQLVQLTWQSNVAFVYDRATFVRRRTFNYSGEGWGLAGDAGGFVLSDGSAQLRFLDPETFREVRRVTVTDGTTPISQLNELEVVNGEVWANVWHTNRIARISPRTGKVVGWIDLAGLMAGSFRLDAEAVLNGIAYDAASRRLFVTGKLWPRLFEIQVVPRRAKPADRAGGSR